MTDYEWDKIYKKLKSDLKEAGDPHPNSAKYKAIQMSTVIRLAWADGFKEGLKEGMAAPK